MERRARLEQPVRGREHRREGGGVRVGAVAHRVQVGEVDHRPDPGGRRAISKTSSALPSSRTRPIISIPKGTARSFCLEPRRGARRAARTTASSAASRVAAEQEAGVEDDELGAAGRGDPGGVVEHAHGAPELRLALHVPEEGGERRVDGERDVARPRDSRRARSAKSLLHPEPALEVELAGA